MNQVNQVNIASVSDVADAMRRDYQPQSGSKALGRTILLVGAGCSRSAGIPLAGEIAQELAIRLADSYGIERANIADPAEALRYLVTSGKFESDLFQGVNGDATDWPSVYDYIFSKHYKTPKEIRGVFSQLFDRIDRRINWTHLCIGELVRLGYVSTILTTNFDQLVLDGLSRSGRLPVVADGLDSLYRISGDSNYPQLIQIHGSRHTYYLRNSQTDTDELANNHAARHAIDELFRTASVFIAIGYGGRERGLMQLLIEAGRRWPDTQIFWISYSDRLAATDKYVAELLATSRYASVVPNQDADDFFRKLLEELKVYVPRAIADPLYPVKDLKENLVYGGNAEIKKLIDDHQDRVNEIQAKYNRSHIASIGDSEMSTAALLSQSQRLQAVGQLSAGIAHDFGSVLSSISSSAEELFSVVSPGVPAYQKLLSIRESANRGASLIRQLLAFSRKQEITPEILDLAEVLDDLLMLLTRLVGNGIVIASQSDPGLWEVKVDISQIEQIIVNLVVNSRDAMPDDGGSVFIELKNHTVRSRLIFGDEVVSSGDYVELSVRDTGKGIEPEIIDRIFEPFFTTKEVGRGSGLGLSMVYGIVKQSGGYITVTSKLNEGSTFRILLPRAFPDKVEATKKTA
ncbi:ATP-binding protein [Mesorhizobium sp. M0816]|uniref:ATP-binding protein n=1 Tax=Mesorhizobium sp. M0816 TaxID=2957006 RepID=UPI0033350C4F